ncbi:ATP synthase subunit delta [Caloramator mitchellensis]|uniref:ATP synthase subunit delta n=1 Tax=Caloramator mitchellensis TaxID=908809 RepID=A0A0R3JXE9_CALMK|nr:F0F1 ATP synthase subunit delta [Caloramator mitchellensis]KRQ87738.1 ATP synthase subunit delta [Caloramator mitchellensis]
MRDVASLKYGYALYEVALKEDKLDEYLEDLKGILDVFKASPELLEFLRHPEITLQNKLAVLSNVFRGRIQDEILRLLDLLVRNDRIDDFRYIYKDYRKFALEHKGIKIALVKTAVPLNDEERNLIKVKFSKIYDSDIEIDEIIDEEIIGGIWVRVKDDVYDGTIKSKLDTMKKTLLSNSEVEIG